MVNGKALCIVFKIRSFCSFVLPPLILLNAAFSILNDTGAVTERVQEAHQNKNCPMMLLFPG
jgi:hypothetical protein